MVVHMLSLEGNLGAGKTVQMHALQKIFANDPSVRFLTEPVEEWQDAGLLGGFYNGEIDCNLFQLSVLSSMAFPLIEAISDAKTSLIITERSPQGNRLTFGEHTLSSHGAQLCYDYIYHKINSFLNKHDVVLNVAYLRLEPEEALARIAARSRDEEINISSAYIHNLHLLHETLIDRLGPLGGKLILNATLPVQQITSILAAEVRRILMVTE